MYFTLHSMSDKRYFLSRWRGRVVLILTIFFFFWALFHYHLTSVDRLSNLLLDNSMGRQRPSTSGMVSLSCSGYINYKLNAKETDEKFIWVLLISSMILKKKIEDPSTKGCISIRTNNLGGASPPRNGYVESYPSDANPRTVYHRWPLPMDPTSKFGLWVWANLCRIYGTDLRLRLQPFIQGVG